jgi:uridine phosphorylase
MTEKLDPWPILANKNHHEASVFRPEALLREARRQRGLTILDIPKICVLDPDGDLVRYLRRTGKGRSHAGWACYHTQLLTFDLPGYGEVGVVGCAVGSSFAVLVAEQMFASGCQCLISVTSAGRITDIGPMPYFILIDRALRDEGTSYHYLPPSEFTDAPNPMLLSRVENQLHRLNVKCYRGTTWTTDAPYRETEKAIAVARAKNVMAVEMEAAALYAFATSSRRAIICFAHVTNTMAQSEGDFEKGEADGATATLAVLGATAAAWVASFEGKA